jgi:uncharacterized repeat protein (TIGR01451 family)
MDRRKRVSVVSLRPLKRLRWLAITLALAFLWIGLVMGSPSSKVLAQSSIAPCATPGKEGVGASLMGIINTYYPPATAVSSVNAGTTTLQVGTPAGASTPITIGDLLLVMQMQDADINSTNTAAYGDGVGGDVPAFPAAQPSDGASGWTALNSAGRYEFVTATSVSGNTIGIRGTGPGNGLNYTYRNQPSNGSKGRSTYQIIRVPQYASATLTAVTALPWNGQIGGVVALDVAGQLTLGSGTVADLRGRGFRGGAGRSLSGASGTADTDYRTLATQTTNASKGEGIAGTPRYVLEYFNPNALDGGGNPTGLLTVTDTGIEGYPNGSYARGAPGNAGGGSTDGRPSNNDENTGGGGGSNGGRGGRGGRAWNSQDPAGGFGGKAFSLTEINDGGRLFMGGGGGAGTTNNASRSVSRSRNTNYSGVLDFDGNDQQQNVGSGVYSSGATGGGIAIIRTNSIAGSGTIDARGANGLSAGQDGAGGGGAGGSVYVSANQGIGNLSVNVQGGEGGWATFRAAHGPGGGGGGGVVVSTEPGVTIAPNGLAGGLAGETGLSGNSNPPNFEGQQGTGLAARITAAQSPGVRSGNQCVPNLAVTKVTSTPSVNNQPGGTTASYAVTVANAVDRATATAVEVTDTLPTGFTYAATQSITLTGGASRTAVSDPAVGSATPAWGSFQIPPGGGVVVTFTVTVASSVATGTYQNPALATYLDPQRQVPTGRATVTYDAATSPDEDVTVTTLGPNLLLVKRITAINGETNRSATGGQTLATYNADSADPYDDNVLDAPAPDPLDTAFWPDPTTFLIGGTAGGQVRPGDEVEYTIYFLSAGDVPARNVRICDRIPNNTQFIPDAFGASPAGILSRQGTNETALTNAIDGDAGYFFPANQDPTQTLPDIVCDGANTNGTVAVALGDLPPAVASGDPEASYGFIRFRVRVN